MSCQALPNSLMWASVIAIPCHQWLIAIAVNVNVRAIRFRWPDAGGLLVGALALRRAALMRRHAQRVRFSDLVVPGVMARRTASSSGSSAI